MPHANRADLQPRAGGVRFSEADERPTPGCQEPTFWLGERPITYEDVLFSGLTGNLSLPQVFFQFFPRGRKVSTWRKHMSVPRTSPVEFPGARRGTEVDVEGLRQQLPLSRLPPLGPKPRQSFLCEKRGWGAYRGFPSFPVLWFCLRSDVCHSGHVQSMDLGFTSGFPD